jgi:hypothetical protein
MSTATHFLAIILSILVLLGIFHLLRTRRLREKYAALWIVIGFGAFIVSIWPSLLSNVANGLGFKIPSNFLFFVNGVLLLLISIQLSVEVSRLEIRTERLAEELAILKASIDPQAGK